MLPHSLSAKKLITDGKGIVSHVAPVWHLRFSFLAPWWTPKPINSRHHLSQLRLARNGASWPDRCTCRFVFRRSVCRYCRSRRFFVNIIIRKRIWDGHAPSQRLPSRPWDHRCPIRSFSVRPWQTDRFLDSRILSFLDEPPDDIIYYYYLFIYLFFNRPLARSS